MAKAEREKERLMKAERDRTDRHRRRKDEETDRRSHATRHGKGLWYSIMLSD
jgi:hypothetical protein